MKTKQPLTNVEIEKDIIHSFKEPQRMSEKEYTSFTLPAIICAVVFVVVSFIDPKLILWGLLAFFLFCVGFVIVHFACLHNKIKRVSIRDYSITTEVVKSTDEEHYNQRYKTMGGCRTRRIDRYVICFENGKDWEIPTENYAWHERLRMHDCDLFQKTHRGDTLIVVTKKDTGKIAVAYHTDYFEYKSESR